MTDGDRWFVAPGDSRCEEDIHRTLGVSPVLARLLVIRGVRTAAEARAFLSPSDGPVHSPEALSGIPTALDRILSAVERGEGVLLHGDYDVDGTSATALLLPALAGLGLRVHHYLPHRIDDGYGVSLRAVEAAGEAGVTLMVTVDCGITAHREIERARQLGIDTVVTDHHAPSESLPGAVATVNPKLPGCSYPNPHLAGVGVAFKLAAGLADRTGRPVLPPGAEELVALGTIADAAAILGESRTLTGRGLESLRNTRRPGLLSLCETARVAPEEVGSDAVAFALAPRLNALGRVGDPDDALYLLLTESWERARQLALAAEEANRERKRIQAATIREIDKQLALRPELADRKALVLWGPDWHRGVIGIVAAKVCDRFHRPAFVISVDPEGNAFGSARSDGAVDIIGALDACADILASSGGHREAGGFRLRADRLDDFRERIWSDAEAAPEMVYEPPELVIDCEMRLADLHEELMAELALLEPHGRGNPRPAFLARGIRTNSEVRLVGTDHLRLSCFQGRQCFQGIAFRQAHLLHQMDLSRIDIVFEPQWNSWRDQRTIELRISDIRPHAPGSARLRPLPAKAPAPPAEPPAADWLMDLRTREEPIPLPIDPPDVVLALTNPETPHGALEEWLRKAWKRSNPVWLDSAALLDRFRPGEHSTFVLCYDAIEQLWDRRISPDHIVLWDFPPSEASLALVGSLRGDGKASARVYVSFNNARFEWQRHILEREHPDRDLLSRLYLAIRRIEHPSPVPIDLVRERLVASRLPAECLEAALAVFQELGFLSVDLERAEAALEPSPQKRSLDESPAYRSRMKVRRERESLARFLLAAPLAEIERRLAGSR